VWVSFLLFIVLAFPAVTVLMARFPTVAAGFGMAIVGGRFGGFAFPFWVALVAFAFPGAWGVSVPFCATLMGPFSFPTALALFVVVSPLSVIGDSRVVRDSDFGRGVNEFLYLELRVALETFVGE
jgi:hypothetical protein